MITDTPLFPKNKIPHLVKVCQIAQLLSVCHQTVYKLIEDGQLTAADITVQTAARRHLRVTRASLLKFYRKRFGHSLERALANPADES